MWPKRAEEILGGGSLYWVIKGSIQCRQKIIRFDEYDSADGVQRCAIVLDPELIPRRANFEAAIPRLAVFESSRCAG